MAIMKCRALTLCLSAALPVAFGGSAESSGLREKADEAIEATEDLIVVGLVSILGGGL